MYCEFCKTHNEGNKYHPGTCDNCGARFDMDLPENQPHHLHAQRIPSIYEFDIGPQFEPRKPVIDWE